jgi:hypothetical protein
MTKTTLKEIQGFFNSITKNLVEGVLADLKHQIDMVNDSIFEGVVHTFDLLNKKGETTIYSGIITKKSAFANHIDISVIIYENDEEIINTNALYAPKEFKKYLENI